MKGHDQIIDLLNEALTHELTSINQYFLHGRLCQNWGFLRLGKKLRHESIDEMKHADLLIERVLYLDGFPNLQRLNPLHIGQSVEEQLQVDLELEKAAVALFNRGVELARSLGDNGTRELLEKILVSEEEHADWIEEQIACIERVGIQNYLAQQMHE